MFCLSFRMKTMKIPQSIPLPMKAFLLKSLRLCHACRWCRLWILAGWLARCGHSRALSTFQCHTVLRVLGAMKSKSSILQPAASFGCLSTLTMPVWFGPSSLISSKIFRKVKTTLHIESWRSQSGNSESLISPPSTSSHEVPEATILKP